MKLYKTSIWRANRISIKFYISLFLIFYILAFGFQPSVRYNIQLGALVWLIYMILLTALQCFYVKTDNKKLYIQNRIYSFWGVTYTYPEILKARFCYNSGGYGIANIVYLQLYSLEKKSWKYAINLVSDEDVLRLIEELKSHGVKVSTTKEFEGYYAAIEQRKREKAQGEALRRKANEYEEACRREREQREK